MHEVSICQTIIDSLENEFDEEELEEIRKVYLRIGILSCVEPTVLKHVFTMMVADGLLQHAELETEMIDVLAFCENCNKEFKVERYIFICADCGKSSSKILEGKELQIHKIIFEKPAYEKTE
ncbi:MAG TPA: hydrogenase maturation nickel metallochaperone HypA [Puia sp.]|jgi:hydrogenase nickel incorporation protein HypA/HybF|nr:hydrogenase maturation nickel metallochaperone HypA [Puia sp.]